MLERLLEALRDADPTRRIQTLQVLALVEETRAIQAVHEIFKNDPDAQVRQTAKWAGSLLWQAQQRGYSTESAMDKYFNQQKTPSDRQEAVIDNLTLRAVDDNALGSHLRVVQTQWEILEEVRQRPATQTQTQTSAIVDDDHLDLLEAGLSRKITDDLDAGLSDNFRKTL